MCIVSDHLKYLRLKVFGPSALVIDCHTQRRYFGTFRNFKRIQDRPKFAAHYLREAIQKQYKLEDILDTRDVIDEIVTHLSPHIKPKENLLHCFPGKT